jgi:beta-mannosidase
VDYAVPGDVHSALIKAGVIPDPYIGKNELLCRWVADEEWVATREFTLAEVDDGPYCLDIDYLDTVATVKLNDFEVLKAENCFRRYQPYVKKALKAGVNIIEVTLHSNTKAANEKQAAQPFYIPYSVSNNPIPNGNMLRKPQCHFGWDWNLAVVPFGICGSFGLRRRPEVELNENLSIIQVYNDDGSVDIKLDAVAVFCVEGQEFEIIASFGDETKTFRITPDSYEHYETISFHVEKPKFWWPAGQGEQHLYELEVRCGEKVESRNIGLRKLELLTDKDEAGNRFVFKVNGREVFCKGANWIPADALPSNATPELTRKLLQAAKDANMNMIRVWGGGYYEKDFFYNICDELGLLVWQDFMFSCSLYPSTEDFLRQVRAEAGKQLSRLRDHACIAVWCGDNELLGALTWFEESRKNRDRYLVNYDRLNRVLETQVKNWGAIWWPSSPSPGILDFGDTWHDDSKGDMHFWSVWHEGRDFEHYYDVRPRFCSEFGFQSFPSLRLIREFVESEEDLSISSAVMEHHQRNKSGNARIAETMFRNFRFPMDFGNFVYLSQVQHGLAMKMAVEYWRSLKPHCMGTLYWQLNDTWPVASWSGLDHGGSWKLLHYMAREFYAPVLVTARKHETDFIVSAVSDLPHDFALSLEVFAVTMSGKKKSVYKANTKLGADGVELARLPLAGFGEGEILLLEWRDEKGDNKRSHVSPVPYKHLPLVNPVLTHKVIARDGAVLVTISSKALALYLALECDVAGHFSNNAFDLLADESVTISFTPDNPSDLSRAAETLVVRDLYSSSHVTH